MSESTEDIRKEVEAAHNRLTQNLNALEYRVKRVTDWRYQFRRRPWAILGGVFAAAVLAGWLSAGTKPAPWR